MEFRSLKISELKSFIENNDHLKDEVIPITPLRAYSQIKNPKASPDDVALTIAQTDNGKIVGYIGALPDEVNNQRCAWNSCWWVKEGAPAEVSMKLFFTFLSNWDKKVLFSEMTPHTASIIKQMGFCTHSDSIGFRGYSRFTLAEILPQKKKSLGTLRPIFVVADWGLNFLLNLTHLFIRDSKGNFQTEIIEQLTNDDDDFIGKHNKSNASKRYAQEHNWISELSWLTNDEDKEKTYKSRYYFSFFTKRFMAYWVRFFVEGELVALVNCTMRDNHLRLPYVYCNQGFERDLASYFYALVKKDSTLSTITTFHQGLSKELRNKRFLFKTNLPKYSAISNDLLTDVDSQDLEYQMGDGDCVFT